MADMLGIDRRINKNNKAYKNLKMGNIPRVDKSIKGWWRYAVMTGELKDKNDNKSQFNLERYNFLLDANFSLSAKCCNVMKKNPSHKYNKDTGRKPITAQMASESKLRTTTWLSKGCNAFDSVNPISNPMSFWTEQDVLLYIKTHNLPICSVYGDVVFDYDKEGQLEGQMDLSEMTQYGIFDTGRRPLKTTGCDRTGCVLCGFGAHCNGDTRFVDLKETHPKFYNLLDVVENNGITYREAIDWINEHGNLNIKY